MNIHHIGYAVKNMEESAAAFRQLGYEKVAEPVQDRERNVCICFMKNGGYLIELVAPMGEGSPVDGYLKKLGPTPYHICYEVKEPLQGVLEKLTGEGYQVIHPEKEAVALNNRKVAFLRRKEVGMIEILECLE